MINRRKQWLVLSCLSGVFPVVFGGCDALYRILDEEGAEEKELVGEVLPYEKNPTVEEIQALLKIYGYNPGRVDGILGVRTRNAIERFQKDNDLKVTRFVDDETWRMLNLMQRKHLIVDQELNLQFIQQILKATGFDPGPIDGKLGNQTISAIKEFQAHHDLTPDGKIGFQTLKVLARYVVLE
jgi:peptidoglycan hydrolase-like protein with peptidoglycan-binding domain